MAEVSGRGIVRNPGIDLLRGVSIVLVVIHHTALRIPLTKTGAAAVLPQRLLRALNWNGANAVTMFFVISGFLITTMSLRRWGSLGAVEPGSFYWQRMTRIMPCLLVLLAVLSVFDLMGVPDYAITRADQSLPRAIVSALGLHLNWYEGVTGYLPGGWDVLWSLSIEEAFYLAFPLLCLMSARLPWLSAVGLTMLALSLPYELNALADASEVWQEKAYLPGMSAIASGIGAAWLANYHRCPGKGGACFGRMVRNCLDGGISVE